MAPQNLKLKHFQIFTKQQNLSLLSQVNHDLYKILHLRVDRNPYKIVLRVL